MVSKAQVMALAAGDAWLEKGANLLLFGPPGGGKSHLAAALGFALVENGWRVLFTRTTDLVQQLQVARRELVLEAAIAKLDRYHLLILDDLAYVTKDQAETSVLFELISARYERRSMLITANQPFGEWGKIFPDQAMTLAAIDRLVHHATILEMNVESYRRKEAVDKARERTTANARDNQSLILIVAPRQSNHGHANIACVLVAPRQSSSRRDRRNGHPDCRCVPIQIVALHRAVPLCALGAAARFGRAVDGLVRALLRGGGEAGDRQRRARHFHMDPEDENVLKIIVYLNDVDAGTGPRRQPRCWRNVPKESVPLRAK